MIKKYFCILLAIFSVQFLFAQQSPIPRPKLVVGIVVDQMRWDYLYRYQERYQADGGFNRLLSQGFSCENTFIPYTPTITACGHACIYTGSVPAIHGITGNGWWDVIENRAVYCTEDDSVQTVGGIGDGGQQSPKNMLATTIGDELRLATNFQSKVIGIALKDRGGILPAGHAANAAYWYNSDDGNFITSTYYMKKLPAWVEKFNSQKLADEKNYESKPFGGDQKKFPYNLKKFMQKNYGVLPATPYGNTITMEMAKAAIDGEQLGADAVTDFLAVSFSSTDYVGHSFGPNSVETEDTYLRLDKDLAELMNYLDTKVGKGQYLLFLSADHGVAHVPGFSVENKLPGGLFSSSKLSKELNDTLKQKYGQDGLVVSMYNYQVHLNQQKIKTNNLDKKAMIQDVIELVQKKEGVARVFALGNVGDVPMPEKIKKMIENGYYPMRGGEVQIMLKPGYIDAYSTTGTTHGSWNPYDSHIPLVWYGWNIKQGKSNREVYMTDIASTICAMLKIQMPSGSIGNVIEEVMK